MSIFCMAMASSTNWSTIWLATQAIATVVTVLVLFFAALFAVSEVREATRARRLQSAVTILDHISSPELRAARRLIYAQHEQLSTLGATDPSWQAANEAIIDMSNGAVDLAQFHTYLSALENVAMLVMHDMAPDDLIEMYMGRMAIKHWDDIGPFIAFMRRKYESDDFLQHFEMMVYLLRHEGLRREAGLRPGFLVRASARMTRRHASNKRELLIARNRERLARDQWRLRPMNHYRTESD